MLLQNLLVDWRRDGRGAKGIRERTVDIDRAATTRLHGNSEREAAARRKATAENRKEIFEHSFAFAHTTLKWSTLIEKNAKKFKGSGISNW